MRPPTETETFFDSSAKLLSTGREGRKAERREELGEEEEGIRGTVRNERRKRTSRQRRDEERKRRHGATTAG